MRKLILLLGILVGFANGQYKLINTSPLPDFSNSIFTGWGLTINLSGLSTISAYHGSSKVASIVSDATTTQYLNPSVAFTDTEIRFKSRMFIPSANDSTVGIRVRIMGGANPFLGTYLVPTKGSWQTVMQENTLDAASYTSFRVYLTQASALSPLGIQNDSLYFDYIYLMAKVDTLWSYSTGNDLDDDTTATLSELFEKRGAHSGGTFITEPGTWDESVTIDSSFTLWRTATAGQAVTVTTVDFNNVTATLFDVYVTNASNDGNITYTYTPSATNEPQRNFRNYNKWSGFKP